MKRKTAMDVQHMAEVLARLAGAAVLGGLQGLEREKLQKPAGLRTHMLVALGAAVFVLATSEAGVSESDLSRVVQGVAAGVGFIGAGTILKVPKTREIEGLTTAASLWLAAALGLAMGAGLVWVPVVSSVLALLILRFAGRVTPSASGPSNSSTAESHDPRPLPHVGNVRSNLSRNGGGSSRARVRRQTQ